MNHHPVHPEGDAVNDPARLSKLLFEARESIEMFADVVEARMGQADKYNRRLVADIDRYRAERGWSPHGFGGEETDETDLTEDEIDQMMARGEPVEVIGKNRPSTGAGSTYVTEWPPKETP